MILALVICQIILIALDKSWAKPADISSGFRWLDSVKNKALLNLRESADEPILQANQHNQGHNGDRIRMRRDNLIEAQAATSLNLSNYTRMDGNQVNSPKSAKNVTSKLKLEGPDSDDSAESVYESYLTSYTTTTQRLTGYKCIETPPVRKINLTFPSGNLSFSPLSIHDEVTMIPLKTTYSATQSVNLVFPLEGSPPPKYHCIEIKKSDSNTKPIKMYKVTQKPRSKTLKKNSSRHRRQGYWLELKQDYTTEKYEEMPKFTTNLVLTYSTRKSKKEKGRRTKTKKLKKKKLMFSKYNQGSESAIDITTILMRTTEFQTEPYPSEVDSENSTLLSNNSVIYEDPHLDLDKILMKNREILSSTSTPGLTIQSFNESSIESGDTSREYPQHSEKPYLHYQSPDYPIPFEAASEKASLMDIFARTKIFKTATEELSQEATTKILYGQELHVR